MLASSFPSEEKYDSAWHERFVRMHADPRMKGMRVSICPELFRAPSATRAEAIKQLEAFVDEGKLEKHEVELKGVRLAMFRLPSHLVPKLSERWEILDRWDDGSGFREREPSPAKEPEQTGIIRRILSIFH